VRNRLATARAQVDYERVPVARQSGPEDQLADEIVDLRILVDQLRESGQPISISSGLLNEMRSSALSADRELTASGKYNEARLLKKIAQLVDQDLIGSIDDLAGPEAKASFTAARAFTVALNNVFTRASAPANLLGTRSTGAEALSAEEAVKSLFTGRTDRVLRNSREISRVGQFLQDEVSPGIELVEGLSEGMDVGRIVGDIPDVMERALRNIRSAVLKPRTGQEAGNDLTLNVQELRNWMQDSNNQQLLAMFPRKLTDDLNDAEAAYELLLTARNQAASGRKEAKARLSFKRLIDKGDETPSATISEALGGQRPEFELNQIWRTISQSEVDNTVRQEARDSLKTGLLDWAISRSSNQNGDLNTKRMYDSLFRPVRPGSSVTVAEWMASKGLLTEKGADDIQLYLAEMTNLQNLLTKEGIDALIKSGDSPLRDLSLRIIGAKLGTSVSGLIGGSEASLIAAAAGSRALRAMFVSKSGINNMKAFKKLLEDPEFLAKMLQTPRTKREAKSMTKAAREWMLSKGFVLGRRIYTAEQTEQEEFDGLPPRTLEELTEKTGRFEMLPVSLPTQEQSDPLTVPPEPQTTVPEAMPPEAVPSEPTAPEPRTTGPLSVQNNNPGNLRLAGQPGAVEGEGGFAAFASPGQGLRALTRQVVLGTQTRDMSLEDFLNKYAPPSENETNKYISFVERQTGLDAKGKVPESRVPQLVRAIIRMEGGQEAIDYFYGEQRAEAEAPQRPPLAQAAPPPMPPAPPSPAPLTPQSIQRTAQVLGPNDEIGRLASEMLMRQGPA